MEEAVQFGKGLLGILGLPEGRVAGGSVLFLNGNGGSCSGPHRLVTEWSRALVENGIPNLRFDYHGRGDSPGLEGAQDLLTMAEDAVAAGTFLDQRLGAPPVAFIAICSGSLVALHCVSSFPLRRLVLLSPDRVLDRRLIPLVRLGTRHVPAYLRKLRHPATWRRMLTGEVHWRLILLEVFKLRAVGRYAQERFRGANLDPGTSGSGYASPYLSHFLAGFRGDLQVWLGGLDPGAREVEREFRSAARRHRCGLDVRMEPELDAVYSAVDAQRRLISESIAWLRGTGAP